MGSLNDLIATYNPSGFATANQQGQATLAHTQAATEQAQEVTRGQAEATRAAQLSNQAAQLALRDQGITRDAMTNVQPVQGEDPATYLGRIIDYTRKNGISSGGYIGLTKNLGTTQETLSK